MGLADTPEAPLLGELSSGSETERLYEDEPNLQTKQEPHPFGWNSCFSYWLLHIRLRDGGIQLIGGGVRRLGLFALLLPAGLFALRAALRLDALCQQHPMRPAPICVARRMRWASPPESVAEARSRVR